MLYSRWFKALERVSLRPFLDIKTMPMAVWASQAQRSFIMCAIKAVRTSWEQCNALAKQVCVVKDGGLGRFHDVVKRDEDRIQTMRISWDAA